MCTWVQCAESVKTPDHLQPPHNAQTVPNRRTLCKVSNTHAWESNMGVVLGLKGILGYIDTNSDTFENTSFLYVFTFFTWLNMCDRFQIPRFSQSTPQCNNAIFKFIHLGAFKRFSFHRTKDAVSVWTEGQNVVFNCIQISVDAAWDDVFVLHNHLFEDTLSSW